MIPKPKDGHRLLSILTMYDRALQALFIMAFDLVRALLAMLKIRIVHTKLPFENNEPGFGIFRF
jgi:hypothetical protein